MKRRNLIAGMGGAALGGSMLVGTGAFSSVSAERTVMVDVVNDPDAYLGLGRCHDEKGDPYPNGDYVNLSNGLMSLDLSESNGNVIGDGVNAEAITEINNVFQICNQGTQVACISLEFDPVENGNQNDAVEIYREPDYVRMGPEREDGAFTLGPGECACFSLLIDTHGISPGDSVADNLFNEITNQGEELKIIAATEDSQVFENPPCFEPDEPKRLPECPFYGTSRSDPTAIYEIQYDPDSDTIDETVVGSITDASSDSNYPNGLAFDPDDVVWYYTEDDGTLRTLAEDDGTLTEETYDSLTDGSTAIAGAAFHDGGYYYIPQDGNELMRAEISGHGGSVDSNDSVTELDWSGIGLGDLAVDRTEEVLYVSTTRTDESGPNFFSVDLNDLTEQNQIVASNDRTKFAVRSQLAFSNGTLWAHNAGNAEWRRVTLSDGSLSEVVATTREYTDLAQCGGPEELPESED